MRTEKQYLAEVARIIDTIERISDRSRKAAMKSFLHKDIYPRMSYYGFRTIMDVHKSIDCMKAGKPDPSAENRCEYMKTMVGIMTVNIAEYEKSKQSGKPKQSIKGLSLHYDRQQKFNDKSDPDRDRE